MQLGYKLSSEEIPPADLVRNARRAEEAGFAFALVSDHFHPWIDRQGQSPFVWGVLGGIAQVTEQLHVGTGVTCPTIRIHPAIVAQASATAAAMMPGRFFLGVGTGENLNEHVVGAPWPPADVRREMLEEAVAVIRQLWQGGVQDHRGAHYIVDNARLYTLPEAPPPIVVAAGGAKAAKLAGRIGDGLVTTSPDAEMVSAFRRAGGSGKPCYAEMSVCVADDEATARHIAHEWWPLPGGPLNAELPLPEHFEFAAKLVTEETVAKSVVCGRDVRRHRDEIGKHVDAGYDRICVHQIGPDQDAMLSFYAREILPHFQQKTRRAA
jgi:G6PDH family F420-dependent oxidoreductase